MFLVGNRVPEGVSLFEGLQFVVALVIAFIDIFKTDDTQVSTKELYQALVSKLNIL